MEQIYKKQHSIRLSMIIYFRSVNTYRHITLFIKK